MVQTPDRAAAQPLRGHTQGLTDPNYPARLSARRKIHGPAGFDPSGMTPYVRATQSPRDLAEAATKALIMREPNEE